jgi:hypothetical protein
MISIFGFRWLESLLRFPGINRMGNQGAAVLCDHYDMLQFPHAMACWCTAYTTPRGVDAPHTHKKKYADGMRSKGRTPTRAEKACTVDWLVF